jgi:uncharacterized protein
VNVFLDTSAFAKRYVAESGSEKVLAVCEQAEQLTVSVICLPELISTLARLLREKKLTKANYVKLKNNATSDLVDVDICQLTPAVLGLTVKLLETNQLRAMDAIHVAAALAVNVDVFVSADQRQLIAARKAGLKTLDVA